jgi:thiopeptide-type bacteriocin biosynthesis protein
MCFRPTPFGSFSSFSVVPWLNGPGIILDDQNPILHLNIDQQAVNRLAETFTDIEIGENYFRCNRTFYMSGKDFRFITTTYSADKSKIYFDLESIERSPFTDELFLRCSGDYVKGQELIVRMMEISGCDLETATDYLQFLAGAQILIPQTANNIIGEDYLERMLAFPGKPALSRALLGNVVGQLQNPGIYDSRQLKSISKQVEGLLPGLDHEKPRQVFYGGLELNTGAGSLDRKYQEQVSEGLRALSVLVSHTQPPMLEQFIRDFISKYDKQRIPLLQAIDPDIGIGYGVLMDTIPMTDLLRDVHFKKPEAANIPIEWSKIHQTLLRKWSENPHRTDPIVFEEADILTLSPDSTLAAPPSLSALFRVVRNGLYLETVGGITGTALIGRFTAWSAELHQISQELTSLEQMANPNVIFADIGQLSDPHADNINRRKHSYAYEIPINVASTLPADSQIALTDLWLSVRGGKLILESEKHQKVVIPRLSTAFNYSRNSLALFRILCDLQFQGLQGNYSFSLEQYFPQMSYYPRVMYKQTILSPAVWHLGGQDLKDIVKASPTDAILKLNQLRGKLKLPAIVALSKFDQQLVFDMDKDDEAAFLIECMKGSDEALLQEYYLPDETVVKTMDGSPLVNQFVALLYKNEVIYPGIQFQDEVPRNKRSESEYIIGTKWLYLKLYCNPAISNNLLTKRLLPILKQLDNADLQSWFFIRYRDSGYHIRLRLKIVETAIGPILLKLKKRLAETVHYHLIREYQADTYRREMERYGSDMITFIEDFFHGSSELVLRYIKVSGLKSFRHSYHSMAFVSVNCLLKRFIPDLPERIVFLDQMVQVFYAEFATDKSLKIDLDQKYRELKTEITSLLSNKRYYAQLKLSPWADLFSTRIDEVLIRASGFSNKRRNQLLADMVHMHLNRLFIDKQRNQELIVYYCLFKYQVGMNAIKKRSS